LTVVKKCGEPHSRFPDRATDGRLPSGPTELAITLGYRHLCVDEHHAVGSRVFHAASAKRTLWRAASGVKGGSGGLVSSSESPL
jgi:hypothetical protein